MCKALNTSYIFTVPADKIGTYFSLLVRYKFLKIKKILFVTVVMINISESL